MNLAEVLQLKYPDAVFNKDIVLADTGNGPFIREWNLAGVAKPSKAKIAQMKLDMQSAFDDKQVDYQREAAYKAAGATIDDLVVAMWEHVIEGRSDAKTALQAKRAQVKLDIPK